MDLKDIRESGLLELYLIGAGSDEERKIVETAIEKYPELSKDINTISKSLEKFANIHGVTPSADLKGKILKSIESSSIKSPISQTKTPNSVSNPVRTLLGLAAVMLGILCFFLNNKIGNLNQDLQKIETECDSISQLSTIQYAFIENLQNPDNQIIKLVATDNYQETQLFLVYNDVNQKNYLQIQNLPTIASNQSFQLWSLKPNQAPIPLTVFQGSEGVFIPVDYEDGTATYAITIEPFGGQKSPTLEHLIGTVSIPS
ncbi:MAG: anti-sigma factor [Saprospiraceae bacterium]